MMASRPTGPHPTTNTAGGGRGGGACWRVADELTAASEPAELVTTALKVLLAAVGRTEPCTVALCWLRKAPWKAFSAQKNAVERMSPSRMPSSSLTPSGI